MMMMIWAEGACGFFYLEKYRKWMVRMGDQFKTGNFNLILYNNVAEQTLKLLQPTERTNERLNIAKSPNKKLVLEQHKPFHRFYLVIEQRVESVALYIVFIELLKIRSDIRMLNCNVIEVERVYETSRNNLNMSLCNRMRWTMKPIRFTVICVVTLKNTLRCCTKCVMRIELVGWSLVLVVVAKKVEGHTRTMEKFR